MEWLQQILDALFPPRETELLVRHADSEILLARMEIRTVFEIVTLLPYQDPLVRACIVESKFHANKKAQGMLAQVLEEYLLVFESEENALGTATLIPIPLAPKRLQERGYNQVEEILRLTQTEIRVAPHLLSRIRDTTPQTKLGGVARHENMAGAFTALHVDTDDTYIVVDDVTTTGATLTDAKRALQESGVQSVVLLALAH